MDHLPLLNGESVAIEIFGHHVIDQQTLHDLDQFLDLVRQRVEEQGMPSGIAEATLVAVEFVDLHAAPPALPPKPRAARGIPLDRDCACAETYGTTRRCRSSARRP